jgi:hypothetical protein
MRIQASEIDRRVVQVDSGPRAEYVRAVDRADDLREKILRLADTSQIAYLERLERRLADAEAEIAERLADVLAERDRTRRRQKGDPLLARGSRRRAGADAALWFGMRLSRVKGL